MLRFALLLTLLSPAAHANLITYEYQGSTPLMLQECLDLDNPNSCPETLGVITGSITLDESELGSLSNAAIDFYCDGFCALPPGLVRAVFGTPDFGSGEQFPFPVTATSIIRLTTNAAKDIVGWEIGLFDGPPDLRLDNLRGDRLYGLGNYPDGLWASAAPGAWSKVPEPPAIALMLLGLALLYWRRSKL